MRRPALVRLRLVLCALLGAASCRGDAPRAMDSAADGVTTRARVAERGAFQSGDETSEWRASRVGDTLRIEERARFGEDGVIERTLRYAADGTLLRADESRQQTVLSGDRSPALMRVTLAVDFTVSPPAATKTVDGQPRPVQAYELDALRRHASALLAAASPAASPASTRAASPDSPP